MMLNQYFFQKSITVFLFEYVIINVLPQLIIRIHEIFQYSSYKYHFLTLIILQIVYLNHSEILRYFVRLMGLVSNEIHISLFSIKPKQFLFLCSFPLIFYEKEHKTNRKQNKITKHVSSVFFIATIPNTMISLLIILILCFFGKLDEPKQNIEVISTISNFLIISKNLSTVHLLPLWMKNYGIIWGIDLGCENESIDQGRSYLDKNINISQCFFSRYLEFSGRGGVISVTVSSFSMNINLSMFYSCSCSENGGAIFFSSLNSYLIMICVSRCSASSEAHFACLIASQVNQVEYLSISNCSHTTSGYYSFRFVNGNQIVDKSNSSMNNAREVSGIFISSPSSLSSLHCTFSNNKVSDYRCIWFYSSSGTISMSFANIVHCNSPSWYGIVSVFGVGSRKMMYCIFQNNQNCLFCVDEGSLEVSRSFIDHSGSFSRSTAVSTSNNNSFTIRMTFQIQYFNSHHCNVDMTLPHRSLEKTIRRSNEETLRMTYERTIDQTIKTTPKYTIPRTYDELICTNQRATSKEISVIFSFLCILYTY